MFLLAAVLITGLLILQQVEVHQRSYHRLVELRVQQDEALSEFTRLQIERGSEVSFERVVNVSTSDMGMKFPEKVVIVHEEETP